METTLLPQDTNAAPQRTARRNGKVARLPKPIRDKINYMIQDGVPYLEIIEKLLPDTAGLNEANLSNWKAGGYIDWLRDVQIAESLQAKYELAYDLAARSGDDNAAGQAVLHSIALNLCEFLAQTDPATIGSSLLSDADKFTRFVNAMVRLSEGGIKCGLHKIRLQDRAAQFAKKITAQERGITDDSLHQAEQKLKLL